MKLGLVGYDHAYVVDIHDSVMVEKAKEALFQDMQDGEEIRAIIGVMGNCKRLLIAEDIPEFLKADEPERRE